MRTVYALLAILGCSSAVNLNFGGLFKIDLTIDANIREALNKLTNDCPVAQDQVCPSQVTYWLYTRDNRDGRQIDENDLGGAGFIKKQLKIIVHGYTNDRNSLMMTSLINAYLDYGEYNIIGIDWGYFVKDGCYLQGVYSINPVAACLSGFLKKVIDCHGLENFENIVHILGHSLGGHVAGRTSSQMQRKHGVQFARLTRFDPALPLFFSGDENKGVADFRDTYHSNIGILGQSAAEADVDVYLNNGQFQPGCGCDLACSHMKSVLYFAESINSEMWGIYCSAWSKLIDGKCDKHAEQDLRLLGDKVDQNEKYVSFITFGKEQSPYLFDKQEYINDGTFNEFDSIGREECSDVIEDKIVAYLSGK
ncbi:phospholipase A1-like [Macrosteles quadrilineatus]|uniref:phospholipase A1-like n=1 Tax=Macrosteles quadrilineatus TaxID=74068 RepID=UPI0023E1F021|nr:phospholipase A1-like [Macrosteles quadrilineatus]